MADRKRTALVLCPEAPYPLAGGGPLRTASLLACLQQRGYAVDVIVFREQGTPDPRSVWPPNTIRSLQVIELPYHRRDWASRVLRNAGRAWRGVAPLMDRFAGFALPVPKEFYDVALVEHAWCAPYGEVLKPRTRRLVLDLHNVESVLHQRMGRAAGGVESLLHRRFARSAEKVERRWLPEFDEVLVASADDAATVTKARRVTVYPNALPWQAQPTVVPGESVVFSGNLAYGPNVQAVAWFATRVWPALRKQQPGLRWRLVGKNAEAVRWVLPQDERIEVVGAVDDAVASLAESRVAVVPLLSGSGTRLKILEAWAAGLAVVSTTVGAEGLAGRDGQELLIADSTSDLIGAIGRLLGDEALRTGLAKAGRTRYEEQYTWPVAWRALDW